MSKNCQNQKLYPKQGEGCLLLGQIRCHKFEYFFTTWGAAYMTCKDSIQCLFQYFKTSTIADSYDLFLKIAKHFLVDNLKRRQSCSAELSSANSGDLLKSRGSSLLNTTCTENQMQNIQPREDVHKIKNNNWAGVQPALPKWAMPILDVFPSSMDAFPKTLVLEDLRSSRGGYIILAKFKFNLVLYCQNKKMGQCPKFPSF